MKDTYLVQRLLPSRKTGSPVRHPTLFLVKALGLTRLHGQCSTKFAPWTTWGPPSTSGELPESSAIFSNCQRRVSFAHLHSRCLQTNAVCLSRECLAEGMGLFPRHRL